MADIELVIKIPEEIRLALINNLQLSIDQQAICDLCIKQAIINGIPLPKGHGKIIDADALINKCAYDLDNNFVIDLIDVKEAPTIIEADEGE